MLQDTTLETLPGGMRLILAPNERAQGVTFGVFVSSGSRHEKPAVAGISHFIEHMLFKGTRERSQLDISRAIEGRGGSFNAWTGEETTCFYARLPYENCNVAIDILADMYRNAAIPDAEFERERLVIAEEIKMYADDPDSVVTENLSHLLYPHNAVGDSIAGSMKTLSRMTPQTLRDYIARAYVPKATILALVGRFDATAVRKRIIGCFAPASGKSPLPFKVARLSDPTLPEMTVERDIQQAHLALGWKTPGVQNDDKYALTVLDGLMGRSMCSRLFQNIREKRGLSYDIHSSFQMFADIGGWMVAGGMDNARRDETFRAIMREIDRLRQKKPSAAEVRRTKEYLCGNYRLSFESAQTQLYAYASSVQAYGRIVPLEEAMAKVNDVTADEIQRVACKYFGDDKVCVSWVLPKKRQ